MRIDKLLWFLRLASTRSAAQAIVAQGHVRINGRRVERTAHAVRCGDVLVMPTPRGVRVVAIDSLPHRRGPPAEAAACYRALDGQQANPIAAADTPPEGPTDHDLCRH